MGQFRFMIVYGKTSRALKHACQELIFYPLPATVAGVSVDWPLDLVRIPEFPYRGVYMLPCGRPTIPSNLGNGCCGFIRT
jgi:hypothetical protein